MGADSSISWTHATFNPWIGCTHVHAGCTHCYAESFAKRYGKATWGLNGTRVKTSESYWRQPHKWNREAEQEGVRRKVFCASLADVFEDWRGILFSHRGLPLHHGPAWGSKEKHVERDMFIGRSLVKMDDLRRDLFALIDATPNLDWLLLTKRPENVRRMTPHVPWSACDSGDCPHERHSDCDTAAQRTFRHNVWLGTSVSNQATADKAVPELLACRDLAPVLFLSAEPLLGSVDFQPAWLDKIDWVIVSGESGHGARPCDIEWIRSIVSQCRAAGVAPFVKQLGANPFSPCGMGENGELGLSDSKGGDPAEWPEDLRVREFPAVDHATANA